MDILVQMKNNYENPEKMEGLKKKLTGEEWQGDVCNVGVITTSDELQSISNLAVIQREWNAQTVLWHFTLTFSIFYCIIISSNLSWDKK